MAATSKPARPARQAPVAPPARRPSPLDSRHPRVKEWVSRFTEEDIPTRFDARTQLPPITEPDELPVFHETEPEPAPPPARKSAAAPVPVESATVESEPQSVPYTPRPSEPEPVVIDSKASALAPEPIALKPEPIVLTPESVVPIAEPQPAAQTNDEAPNKRRKRKQRERAAEQTPVARQVETTAGTPVIAAKPPAPARRPGTAAAPAPMSEGQVAVVESSPEDPPVVTITPAPPPARKPGDPRSPVYGRFVQVVVPGVLMLGVAAVAIIAGTRGGFEHDPPQTPAQASSAATAPTQEVVPPAPVPPTVEPSATAAPAESAFSEPPAGAVPANFCLAVGTYLFEDRARTASRNLAHRTRLDAWVETVQEDGTRNYRVLIGGFATQADAEQAADKLLGRGLVSEAMVEPTPAGHLKQ